MDVADFVRIQFFTCVFVQVLSVPNTNFDFSFATGKILARAHQSERQSEQFGQQCFA